MTRRLVRTPEGWGLWHEGEVEALRWGLTDILRGRPVEPTGRPLPPALLAPAEAQDLWAAGVTYERSLSARTEESREPDVYERVYAAERPELFFKAHGGDIRGPGQDGCIRSDSDWNAPEAELVLVLDAVGRIFGYSVGDDLSSRSIEGENPLYLPQAKVYEGSAVLGPWIVPAEEVDEPFDIVLEMRRGGKAIFTGSTSTAKMRRSTENLAAWLTSGLRFPDGVLLMTGTGIVPGDDMTLEAGDEVCITVQGLGTLTHGVKTLPCPLLAQSR
jgi:2-dehydro-3-deoxy-D-arabinonate dehydratase